MKRICYSVALTLFTFCSFAQQKSDPVNPKTTLEARQILSYIYSIKGKGMLSGQHSYTEQPNRFIDSVEAITGKKPAVWGADFIWSGTKDLGQTVVDEAIKRHKEGYIISLMWHQGRPSDNPPYGWKRVCRLILPMNSGKN